MSLIVYDRSILAAQVWFLPVVYCSFAETFYCLAGKFFESLALQQKFSQRQLLTPVSK